MKIAITADLHLTSRQQRPERFAALENIFSQLHSLQIDALIIAGDLHDATYDNFAEFEALCRQPENRNIQVWVIPGNHDPNISQSAITTDNVRIFSQPELVSLGSAGLSLLFIPYQVGKGMGEEIAGFGDQLQVERWGLVGHGDWMGNVKIANPYEMGVFMPLSQRDLDVYRPVKVFLGHIHAPYDGLIVCYPGSPCGMDITETGRRRFVTYDTLSNTVEPHWVDSLYIYFNRTFTIFPVDNEAASVEGMLQAWIASWELMPAEKSKARVRVKLSGYATDKNQLKQVVLNTLNGYQLEKEPDLDEVSVTTDPRRGQILNLVKERIDGLNWPEGPDEPSREKILLAAIRRVYER
jgi:DNA repair exonuclease SbcCD nuclease subunit